MYKMRCCNILIVEAIGLILSSCAGLSDFTNDNPVLVSIAVREAVVKYIDVGSTAEEKKARAVGAQKVLEKVRGVVGVDGKTSVALIIDYANKVINWDSLNSADKIAVQDILMLVDVSLRQKSVEIDPNTLVAVSGIMDAAISATKYY